MGWKRAEEVGNQFGGHQDIQARNEGGLAKDDSYRKRDQWMESRQVLETEVRTLAGRLNDSRFLASANG